MEKFIPLGERLLLQRADEDKTAGGILLPEQFQNKQAIYNVIAVSNKITDIQEGDKVIAVPDGSQKVKINGVGECAVIEARRIVGVLND